jgi:NAD+ kinase
MQMSVPPVMAFNLGTLGFLTPFEFNNYQERVSAVLEGNNKKQSITVSESLK